MAGFKITEFKGLRPHVSATKLLPGEAKTAQNVKLGSGDLEPIPEKSTEQAVSATRTPLTIYKFDNNGSPLWFEWDDVVDVVRGPVKDDSIERTYYTGDTLGNGAPKLTTTTLADQGNGGPYPEDWLYIGVPAPLRAPTVTPQPLPEDKATDTRLASNLRSDEVIVDLVKWTVYPGTGTRNQTWRPTGTATGPIKFELTPGMSFRVLSVINGNKVTLESATEPGNALRTFNSDKTTPYDWHPMDEQGTTQTADFIGFRVPIGLEVTIPDHKLVVGDKIVVSANNYGIELPVSSTSDFYEQSWDSPTEIDDLTGAYYAVEDARLSASATSGDSYWQLNGSFYYDVDRAGSANNELEDRTYVYTYVNSLGEEGPPSSPSTSVPIIDGQSVLLSGLSIPPTIGYDITLMRIYRTNSTEAGTEYQFVSEINVSHTYTDSTASLDLGEVISSTSFDPPPSEMQGITTMPNGMMVGFVGKQLYFCEPYHPHAWPAEYDQAVDYDIVGLASFGNSVAVLTEGWPYVMTGSHPRNINIRPVKVNQACLSKESIATDRDRVYYASPDGIIELGVNGIRNVTSDLMDKADWATYSPSTLVAEFYEGRYYGFYDYDITSVPDVITAEISGTITDSDEADVVNGGSTIIITLTNDTWVAAGATFDAQRQAIIDGISDTDTPQTLGWDNIVRDTNLSVTDVVRTSDSVVKVTLPANPTYSIASSEVIRVTIPHEALTISTSDLVCGSTFTIREQLHLTTITIDGSIDGATEAQIVSGGRTIWLYCTEDSYITLADGFNDYRQAVIDGIRATTNEQNGWNDTVPQKLSVDNVSRNIDSLIIISLPGIPDYAVTANETLTCTVPHEILQTQEDIDPVSSNSAGIIATGEKAAIFGGTLVSGGALETEIVAGGETLTITLTNDTWVAAGTGPIGSTAVTQSIIDALVATSSQTLGWNNVVVPGIETADLVRTSSTVATITLDAESTYSIADNETVGMTIPSAALTGGTSFDVTNTFGITAERPSAAVIDGTVTSTTYENDIVTGGKTIVISLSDDTFINSGAEALGSLSDTNELIDGLNAATSPTNGWNNEIANTSGGGSLTASAVSRDGDQQVTITLPADAQYDISATETITATIPAAVLTSASAIVAAPTFNIYEDVTATAAISGTATAGINEADVVAGGKVVDITLTGDTFVDGAYFTDAKQAIIDGFANTVGTEWDLEVSNISVNAVTRQSDTVARLTLPALSGYSIATNETVTCTVPAAAMDLTGSPVVASGSITIAAQTDDTTCTLGGTVTASIDEDDITTGGKTITLTLSDDTWLAAGTGPIGSTANTQAIIDGLDGDGTEWDAERSAIDTTDVVRTSNTVATITLPAIAGYDLTHVDTETVTATVPAAVLNVGTTEVVATPSFTIDSVAPPATTAALTGTAVDVQINEDDIVTGGKTIIVTLTNNTYKTSDAAPIGNSAASQAFIDGLNAAGNPSSGWNQEVRDRMSLGALARTSDTVATFTLPATAGYDITADETITVTVPSEVLVTTSGDVTATPTFDVDFTPDVQLSTQSESHSNPGGVCYSGFEFYSDGHIAVIGPGLSDRTPIDALEWWGDQPEPGIGASYDIRHTTGSSFDTEASAADVWIQLSSNRIYYNRVLTRNAPDVSNSIATFEIRATGSGGALDSAVFTCSASN
jgi:hypothetical protein